MPYFKIRRQEWKAVEHNHGDRFFNDIIGTFCTYNIIETFFFLFLDRWMLNQPSLVIFIYYSDSEANKLPHLKTQTFNRWLSACPTPSPLPLTIYINNKIQNIFGLGLFLLLSLTCRVLV